MRHLLSYSFSRNSPYLRAAVHCRFSRPHLKLIILLVNLWCHTWAQRVCIEKRLLWRPQNFEKVRLLITALYRRDSDIYAPYRRAEDDYDAQLRGKDAHEAMKDTELLVRSKTKLALWVVSNCGGTRDSKKRMSFAQQLIKYGLNLDLFGRCFSRNISTLDLQGIVRKYKFYFAFENSMHCRDYVTEKFFKNSLLYGAVPVVLGATKGDYEAIAPAHSFIFAEAFTPEKLVEYLQYLDSNETAYGEYFAWRTSSEGALWRHSSVKNKWCQLCRVLHGINVDKYASNVSLNRSVPAASLFRFHQERHVVPSLSAWWYGTENDYCLKT